MGAIEKGLEITNAAINSNTERYIDELYKRLQRKGFLRRDCARMIKRDRNVFSALLLASGEGDAMVTGLTRSYMTALTDILKVIDQEENQILFGLSILLHKDRTIFLADTTINELPSSEELMDIAIQSAKEVRLMGHEPRVAFLSFSNFGNPMFEKADRIRQTIALMDRRNDIDFEYDGEMQANVALNPEVLKLYPFCKLSEPANILIMPALHSANISSKLLQELGGGTLIGPVLCGLKKPVQILNIGDRESDILNLAAIGAHRTSKTK